MPRGRKSRMPVGFDGHRAQTPRVACNMVRQGQRGGFTLVELLVVVAIIALLLGIMVPALSQARLTARVVVAHAELRGVRQAMSMYREENDQQIPPTRFSCSTRTAYELPVELGPYLPGGQKNGVAIVDMPDPFTGEGYKYRAVGAAIMNETTVMENAATLWVPDDFPQSRSLTGRYYDDPASSPARYAVWSMGPNPDAPKFDIPGRLPIPRRYWFDRSDKVGVIAHMEDREWHVYMSE